MTSAQELLDLTQHNSSFSRKTPGLQLAVDSTSMTAFKTCPRFYEYSIIRGMTPRQLSVHLSFGLHLHRARETYDHRRMDGADHEEALQAALHEALTRTWDKELSRGWITTGPGADKKTRLSLVRTIVWYLDQFGRDDPIKTLRLTNGKPAVELSFRYDLGFESMAGEPFVSCGHLDRVGELGGSNYVIDIKTTGHQLSPQWFKDWTPGNQFSNYSMGGKIAYSFDVKGLIVDGIQVGATFCRCQRGLVPRPIPLLEEWLDDTKYYLRMMEVCAIQRYWPQNDTSCSKYGGCQYRDVCSRNPEGRLKWAQSDFVLRVWDPLQIRGDI